MFKKWNSKAKPWFRIETKTKKIQELIKQISAVRSNLSASVNLDKISKKELEFFRDCWRLWEKEIKKKGYQIYPASFGKLEKPVGKIILGCSPRVSKTRNILIVPGIKKDSKDISEPISMSIYPSKTNFPDSHQNKSLPPHWRGILGEFELFLAHIDIQSPLSCGIESINKSKIVSFVKHSELIKKELIRRKQTLKKSIQKESSNYQIATNYWRLEECFWGIFHGDDRPEGFSFFDILKKRAQDWRAVLFREHKIEVTNFIPRRHNLASINKDISGIILTRKEGFAPGVVLKQLRPKVTVEENNVKRVLKGRVIAT